MNLIMENWRSFLVEGNIGSPSLIDLDFLDLLDKEKVNEAPKWMRNLAMVGGLAGLGVGVGAGIGTAIDDDSSKQQVTQQADADDDLMGKLVKRKGSPQQYMKAMLQVHSDSITDAPSSGNYKWIPPENISNNDILPYMSMRVKDYREAQQAKDIKTLHKHLFGTSGMWGGSDMTMIGKAQVLPPSWSITFDTYRTKVEYKIQQVLKDVDMLGEEGVAEKFGMPYEKIEKKLQQLQNTIITK